MGSKRLKSRGGSVQNSCIFITDSTRKGNERQRILFGVTDDSILAERTVHSGETGHKDFKPLTEVYLGDTARHTDAVVRGNGKTPIQIRKTDSSGAHSYRLLRQSWYRMDLISRTGAISSVYESREGDRLRLFLMIGGAESAGRPLGSVAAVWTPPSSTNSSFLG